jgi:hypothetical protein
MGCSPYMSSQGQWQSPQRSPAANSQVPFSKHRLAPACPGGLPSPVADPAKSRVQPGIKRASRLEERIRASFFGLDRRGGLSGSWLWQVPVTNEERKFLKARRSAGPVSSCLSNRPRELLVCPEPRRRAVPVLPGQYPFSHRRTSAQQGEPEQSYQLGA